MVDLVILLVELMRKRSAFALFDVLEVHPMVEVEMGLALLADAV